MKKRTYDYELSFITENEWGQKVIVEAGFELEKDDFNRHVWHIIKLKVKTYAFHTPYETTNQEDKDFCAQAYEELSKELAA